VCGIIGYAGARPALDVVMEGLRRLEYRGYDSAGVAILDGELRTCRRAGKLTSLEKALADQTLSGTMGMGHTRWATHGAPTDRNAHPQLSCGGEVAVVHNGIIENFASLRQQLLTRGHELRSDTDTEVVAHLLEEEFTGDLGEAMRSVCRELQGAFTIVALHRDAPEMLVGARRNSPLVIGEGEGENFLASDVAAFVGYTDRAIAVDEDQVVELSREGYRISTTSGQPATGREYRVDWDLSAAEKGGYPNFMLKEIAEQPAAVAQTLLGRLTVDGLLALDEMRLSDQELRDATKVFIVGCGSAHHAGLIAKYAIEHWIRVPCEVELSSEFRYRDPVLDRDTLVVAISQSGETMDTLMAVRHAREQGSRVLAICHSNGATIPRESDAVLYTRGGPEIGVAATKTFLAQVTATYLLALYLAQVRATKFGDEISMVVRQLGAVPQLIQETLGRSGPVRELARELAGAKAVLFLGRHVGYPVALEGALKLKELAYMHAEGFPAGELKHGPIALVEPGLPVVVAMPARRGRSPLHAKMLSNIQEIRARGARTIVIAEDGDDEVTPFADAVFWVPQVPTLLGPLVYTVPLQVFACELAMARGLDVDQPRNLAKSVTVE
jgi:glucosamine--fructose-6-phosphate aminotransferase (isomerizing)